MKTEIREPRTILRLIGAAILLAGLAGSIVIYLTAANEEDDSVYGEISGVKPQETKMFRHAVELYGGKANVIAVDFMRWFNGLWHGKALAFTLACITIFISYGCFFSAKRIQAGPKSGDRG